MLVTVLGKLIYITTCLRYVHLYILRRHNLLGAGNAIFFNIVDVRVTRGVQASSKSIQDTGIYVGGEPVHCWIFVTDCATRLENGLSGFLDFFWLGGLLEEYHHFCMAHDAQWIVERSKFIHSA